MFEVQEALDSQKTDFALKEVFISLIYTKFRKHFIEEKKL